MRMRRAHLTMRTEGITAFSNRYGVEVWTYKNDTKTIRWTEIFLKTEKTAPFSFENGLLWTGPNKLFFKFGVQFSTSGFLSLLSCLPEHKQGENLAWSTAIVPVFWFCWTKWGFSREEILAYCAVVLQPGWCLPPFVAVVEKRYKTMLCMAELHLNIWAYPQRSSSG